MRNWSTRCSKKSTGLPTATTKATTPTTSAGEEASSREPVRPAARLGGGRRSPLDSESRAGYDEGRAPPPPSAARPADRISSTAIARERLVGRRVEVGQRREHRSGPGATASDQPDQRPRPLASTGQMNTASAAAIAEQRAAALGQQRHLDRSVSPRRVRRHASPSRAREFVASGERGPESRSRRRPRWRCGTPAGTAASRRPRGRSGCRRPKSITPAASQPGDAGGDRDRGEREVHPWAPSRLHSQRPRPKQTRVAGDPLRVGERRRPGAGSRRAESADQRRGPAGRPSASITGRDRPRSPRQGAHQREDHQARRRARGSRGASRPRSRRPA